MTRRNVFDILVAGEINPDLILSGNVIPEFGQVEQLVNSADLTVGSSSAIFACGADRLGLKVVLRWRVWRGYFRALYAGRTFPGRRGCFRRDR